VSERKKGDFDSVPADVWDGIGKESRHREEKYQKHKKRLEAGEIEVNTQRAIEETKLHSNIQGLRDSLVKLIEDVEEAGLGEKLLGFHATHESGYHSHCIICTELLSTGQWLRDWEPTAVFDPADRRKHPVCQICFGDGKIPVTARALYHPIRYPEEIRPCHACVKNN